MAPSPRRFLVALDDTERAAVVFEGARDFGTRQGARLVLLHVIVPDDGLTLPDRVLGPELASALRVAEQQLAALGASLPTGMLEATEVAVGEPWRVICRVAQERAADLVVLGSHGANSLEKLFGTTATRVLTHADRSVLVLRPPVP